MTLPPWLQLLIYALAVARVTGLVVADSITEPVRDALIGWLDDRPATMGAFIADLIGCQWCASVWVSALAAPLVWFWGDSPVMLVLALWMALSQVTGMFSNQGR